MGFCKADENPFGPVQLYVAPETELDVSKRFWPAHTGPFDEIVGVPGIAFTTMAIVPAGPVQPLNDALAEYTPAADVEARRVGFCNADVKLFGPFHEYVLPAEDAARLSVCPTHTGELLESAGAVGVVTGDTVTV